MNITYSQKIPMPIYELEKLFNSVFLANFHRIELGFSMKWHFLCDFKTTCTISRKFDVGQTIKYNARIRQQHAICILNNKTPQFRGICKQYTYYQSNFQKKSKSIFSYKHTQYLKGKMQFCGQDFELIITLLHETYFSEV